MIVTCYYDIYNKSERFTEYAQLFTDLALSNIPITLFTEPELVSKCSIFPSNVRIIGIPLESFELYSVGMNFKGL
jgi:hypothetical protein